MLSEHTLEEISARLGLAAPVRFEEVTGSTNATCASLAAAGAPEWTLVAAAHQTAGRGRLDRAWRDRMGSALLFSVLLRPAVDPAAAGLIPLLAGVATVEAARDVAGAAAGCKWPNDVLVAERKAAGILAESSFDGGRMNHLVLGIGVNLGEPPATVDGAGSIGPADPDALLEAILGAFRRRYRPEDAGFAADVVAAYRPVALTLDRRVRARTLDGRVIEGRAVDVSELGALVVETAPGRVEAVAFGDVHHLDP
jgi:BirA family transcriptional regulator, biotin operon repressor / biotin---[acetyl-CoA-carboxylase] ligase